MYIMEIKKSKFIFINVVIFLKLVCAIDEKSITVVLDTTNSMRDEIDNLKNYIPSVLQAINNTNIANYILVPYSDPDPGSITISPTYNDFINVLNTVSLTGGGQCPENTLKAIKKALENSYWYSYIFVFTDAQARDYRDFHMVRQLCLNRHSQVFIFLTGKCLEENISPDAEQVFYEIAKSCSGSFLHVHETEFLKIFPFIREISNVDWTEVNTPAKFYNNFQYTLTIDKFTTNMLIALSGHSPMIDIRNTASVGSAMAKTILQTTNSLVLSMDNLEEGNYTVDISCQGHAAATFYRRMVINFRYGFSPKRPKSIIETASRPIPDETSHIYIELPENIGVTIDSVQLQFIYDNLEMTIPFDVLENTETKYIGTAIIQPNKHFKILIVCKDTTTQTEIKAKSEVLEAQKRDVMPKATKPYVQLTELDKIFVDFGTSYTMSCKVNAYPEPNIWWENDSREMLPSESALLEMPMVYISYVHIDNATTNATISCKAANSEGESSLDLEFLVNRPFTFDVIQYPADMTVEYGEEGLLYCEVNAFPDAEIKWYHNDTLIDYSDNIQLVQEEHKLVINRMSLDDTGEYKCEITNAIETKTFVASVSISGLEAPEVKITNSDILLNLGEEFKEICQIYKGKPLPFVTWKYKAKSENDYGDIPNGATVDKNTLIISSVSKEHEGIYGCEASNVLGTDMRNVAINVKYAPKIMNDDESLQVRVGDLVTIPCDVDASPEATVHWEMYQDDVIIAFDHRHVTDNKYTHRFTAEPNDSGMYHCVAVNSLGRAIRNVTLNVLMDPYIEPVASYMRVVHAGTTITFPCNVKYANPLPSVTWEFTNRYSQKSILRSGTSVRKLDLTLSSVNKKDEGTYQCLAKNEYGSDTIKITLAVI